MSIIKKVEKDGESYLIIRDQARLVQKYTKQNVMEEMIEEGYKATLDVMPQIMEIFARKKRSKKKPESNDIIFIR